MPDTTVKYFHSSMSGAPALSGSAGSLITVLDACLVNGFGSVTLDSLVVSGNVATGTKSAGHNLAMLGATGPVVRIEGATPSGLNGDWRIASVPNSTTFTFATSGISDQTASGTITAKRAPAGFSKAFSGTNKAAYRADDVASTRFYLRVDDSPTQYPTVAGYEEMTSVDSGTNAFYDVSGICVIEKSNEVSSVARAWTLIADKKLFYLFTNYSSFWSGYAFGDIVSFRPGDAFNCWLFTTKLGMSNEFTTVAYGNTVTPVGSVLARSYTQIGGAIGANRFTHSRCAQFMSFTGLSYPSPVDNGAYLSPVEIWEGNVVIRGVAPGLYSPLHSIPHGTVIENIPNAIGRTFISQKVRDQYCVVINISGPWRE